LEQKQVLGIVDATEEEPEDATEPKSLQEAARNRTVDHSPRDGAVLQQQYGVQKDGIALWDQLKDDYKSKVKLNVWAL
jgi:hypothetical protein